MKGNLGSEVLLKAETLSVDNFATTNSLWAPVATGLPVDASLRLYAISEYGGLQMTDRAITTCCLPLNRGMRGK
jgi:hypothetical protein